MQQLGHVPANNLPQQVQYLSANICRAYAGYLVAGKLAGQLAKHQLADQMPHGLLLVSGLHQTVRLVPHPQSQT